MRLRADWTRGPCEFATGEVIITSAPSVTMCGRLGRARRGVTWCDVYACDECYRRWLTGRIEREVGSE